MEAIKCGDERRRNGAVISVPLLHPHPLNKSAQWHLNESLSKFWLITAWNKCGTKKLCSTLYMLEEWTCCCLISSLSFTSTWVPLFAERACNFAVQGCVLFPDLWHFFSPRDLKELIWEAVFVSLWLLNSRVYLFLIQQASIICL